MSKATNLFIIALLLCCSLSYAARPEPVLPREDTLAKTQHGGDETHHADLVDVSCEDVGDEECLMRRTLAAHVDYIYTQKEKP